jgi:hypothetical protein
MENFKYKSDCTNSSQEALLRYLFSRNMGVEQTLNESKHVFYGSDVLLIHDIVLSSEYAQNALMSLSTLRLSIL